MRSLVKKLKVGEKLARPAREIVEIKRKIERTFSEITTNIIAAKQCNQRGQQSDLLFFAKILIEKCNMHERHFALLLLCRGIFAPIYKSDCRWCQEKIDVNRLTGQPFDTMRSTFKNGMALFGQKQPSLSSRAVFPFFLIALRSHESIARNEIEPVSNRIKNAIVPSQLSN